MSRDSLTQCEIVFISLGYQTVILDALKKAGSRNRTRWSCDGQARARKNPLVKTRVTTMRSSTCITVQVVNRPNPKAALTRVVSACCVLKLLIIQRFGWEPIPSRPSCACNLTSRSSQSLALCIFFCNNLFLFLANHVRK